MYVIVVYDVADQERMNRIRAFLKRYMSWIQNSVFEGELTEGQLEAVRTEISRMVDEDDSVVFYVARSKQAIERIAIGRTKGEERFIF